MKHNSSWKLLATPLRAAMHMQVKSCLCLQTCCPTMTSSASILLKAWLPLQGESSSIKTSGMG